MVYNVYYINIAKMKNDNIFKWHILFSCISGYIYTALLWVVLGQSRQDLYILSNNRKSGF